MKTRGFTLGTEDEGGAPDLVREAQEDLEGRFKEWEDDGGVLGAQGKR